MLILFGWNQGVAGRTSDALERFSSAATDTNTIAHQGVEGRISWCDWKCERRTRLVSPFGSGMTGEGDLGPEFYGGMVHRGREAAQRTARGVALKGVGGLINN